MPTLRRLLSLFGITLICGLFLLSPSRSHAATAADSEYLLGVFPFLPVPNLEGIFAPVAAELSVPLKKTVRVRLTSTYGAFISALHDQTFDIIHVHPFDYIRFAHPRGYLPLVARSEDLFAQFSVKKGSPITGIADLKGKRIGTPPATGAVTYLALDALQKQGLQPDKNITVKHFPNHLACLQQLQIGSVDSCATSASTLKTFESQFKLTFTRIGHSISIPHTMFAVHKRVPASDRKIILDTLHFSTLSTVDPHLRQLFIESSDAVTGRYFKPVTDRDYNPARTILKRLGSK